MTGKYAPMLTDDVIVCQARSQPHPQYRLQSSHFEQRHEGVSSSRKRELRFMLYLKPGSTRTRAALLRSVRLGQNNNLENADDDGLGQGEHTCRLRQVKSW
ncbi:MAG: hypothetical protein M1831_005654 [Alyxoria varia]|nr:MAG: hypothetical protein M1831_005654 [Alyxoria varia]